MYAAHRFVGLVCACVLLFVTAHAFAGQARNQELTIGEQQELLVKECKPSADQQTLLKEKFKAKQDALDSWEKTNGEKLKAAQAAAMAARKGTDQAAKKTANDAVKALVDERKASAADADKAILGVLTDDQKDTWAGVQLAQITLAKYKRSNPTDEQTAKIKHACLVAARDLAGFSGDDKKDKQGRQTIEKALKWAIDNVILEIAPVKPAKPAEPATAATLPATPAPAAPGATPAAPAPTTPATTPEPAK